MLTHPTSRHAASVRLSEVAVPWTEVLAAALSGPDCVVHGMGQATRTLPVGVWAADAVASDETLLDHCTDLALDVGCGPGRMTYAMARRGWRVLGIDVMPEAVQLTRSRGVAALQRDVFSELPGEGRWGCVLLADGNIGIGGDPVSLLRRCAALLAPGGRVVVDLAPPGSGLVTYDLRLECSGMQSGTFGWSVVDPASISDVALAAGLRVGFVHHHQERWYSVLTKDVR